MPIDDATIRSAADRLRQAHSSRTPCEPVADLLARGGVADAYAVQELNTERALADGRRLVGRKIGLTSAVVQTQMGVDQPDYGMLFADMAVDEGSDVDIGRLLQPRAEAEIAFVLKRDLPDPDTTVAEVTAGDRLRPGRHRDRRFPGRRLEDRNPRHHRRQCVVGALRTRFDARCAR